MIRRALAAKLFDAFFIQRWNDRVRPIDLTEMDKNAHKMMIAYCFGKYEEQEGNNVDWIKIIKGGIFELLKRIVISDIKSPVYHKIKTDYPNEYKELNLWVYQSLKPYLGDVSEDFAADFLEYLQDPNWISGVSADILWASHTEASYWEFKVIKKADPFLGQFEDIEKNINRWLDQHRNLKGKKILGNPSTAKNLQTFLDLCGSLRLQVRWSQAPRLVRTSVLGHMFLVAILSFLFSMQLDPSPCPKRVYNNFFGGLFHDLPEAVTRDIISPVKRAVSGLPEAIGKIEQEMVNDSIYPLLERSWKKEFNYFTKDEFKSKIKNHKDNKRLKKVSSDAINQHYNSDNYDPIDGELIEAADKFAAFLEAYATLNYSFASKHFWDGLYGIAGKEKRRVIAGIDMGTLYADFEQT